MAVRRLGITVFVRLTNVDLLAGDAVVIEQLFVPALKLTLMRQVVDRRGQAVAAMPSRNAA